jgi:hypothetical protein
MKDPKRRYRRWLRVYPKAYRTVRGEEILATLLDSTDQGRLPARDLLYVLAHAIRVRISQMMRGPGRRPLPQPVRLVTWILVGSAAIDWINAILDHGYPKHPGAGPSPVVAGFILLGLNFLLQARRRILFMLVLGVFGEFIASIVVHSRPIYGGLVLASPYFLFVVLLLVGWKRYMTAIAGDEPRPEVRGTTASRPSAPSTGAP